mmetsp:Transcript_16108/g.26308  ORF Transcript_16108/g.26308 Transcript_16108/m.26308 type:complete len:197 (-) Transcript_16108:73-663(-)
MKGIKCLLLDGKRMLLGLHNLKMVEEDPVRLSRLVEVLDKVVNAIWLQDVEKDQVLQCFEPVLRECQGRSQVADKLWELYRKICEKNLKENVKMEFDKLCDEVGLKETLKSIEGTRKAVSKEKIALAPIDPEEHISKLVCSLKHERQCILEERLKELESRNSELESLLVSKESELASVIERSSRALDPVSSMCVDV